MEKFHDIQSLYKYLDENAIDYYINSKQIADLFRDLIDTNSVDLSIIQWEIDCFNFVTTEGELKPSAIFTDEKGDKIAYPNLASFEENGFHYLAKRLNSTTNSFLRSRYAHVLWCSPQSMVFMLKLLLILI